MGWLDATDSAREYTYDVYKHQPKKCNSTEESVKEQIDTKNNNQTKVVQNELQTTLQDQHSLEDADLET